MKYTTKRDKDGTIKTFKSDSEGGTSAGITTRAPGNPGTTVGVYKDKNVASIGGNTRIMGKQVGGSVGFDKGRPFGSANINGKVIAKFGPQGDEIQKGLKKFKKKNK